MKYLSMQYLSIVPQYWLPDNPAHQLQLEVAAGAELVEHQEPLLVQGPHLGHTWLTHGHHQQCYLYSVLCNVHLEPDVDGLRPLVAHHPHEALAGQEAQLAPDKIIFISN